MQYHSEGETGAQQVGVNHTQTADEGWRHRQKDPEGSQSHPQNCQNGNHPHPRQQAGLELE